MGRDHESKLPTKREVIDYLNELDSTLYAESDAEGLKTFKVSLEYDDATHEITGFIGNEQEDDEVETIAPDQRITYHVTILGCDFFWKANPTSRDAEERQYDFPDLADGESLRDEDGLPVDMKTELIHTLNVCVDTLSPYGGDSSTTPEAIENALLDASTPGEENFYVRDDETHGGPVYFFDNPEEVPDGLVAIDIPTATNILFGSDLPVEMLY